VSFSLKKHEILRSKKSIKELFENGSSFFLYPFKVHFLPNPDSQNNQVLFSVSKRNFKKAVDRNLLRRRIREAYRLNKNILTTDQKEQFSISIALIYISKFKLPYNEIEDKLKQVFIRLNKTKYQK
jgi:ribonuclease P protein component